MYNLIDWWGLAARRVDFFRMSHATTRNGRAKGLSRPGLLCKALMGLGLIAASPAALSQPVVNGLYWGDGDNTRYQLYATSEHGSQLFTYLDIVNTTLYVVLVVNQPNTNDNVCSDEKAYQQSAGWPNKRGCDRMTDSEFAAFTLACAPGSDNEWSWQQPYACASGTDANGVPNNWVSNSTCGPGSDAVDWPPGVEASSSTSFVWSVNNYQSAAPATRAWDLYNGTNGSNVGAWKSPFLTSAPSDVTAVPGYDTYSDGDGNGLFYEWEWPMVYEWSVDLGPGGANCGGEGIFVVTGLSHHSPAKNSDENDDFDDPPEDTRFSDWGDLPDSYGTSGGPSHYITVNGPYLGADLQPELDGSPTNDATGDGSEEDGVVADLDDTWTDGSTASIDVTVSNAPVGAILAGWFDWNGDGDVDDPGEYFTWTVSEGVNTLTLTVGGGFDPQTDDLYARFRIFSSGAAAPDGDLTQADSIGTATDGEVEDYYYPANSLPVSINAFSSSFAGGGLAVSWQTATETNNVGFELWGQGYDGEWRTLTDFIGSKGMNSALPQSYEEVVSGGSDIAALALVDYDTRGRPERFGPFTPGESYGEVQPVERIDWEGPRVRRQQRLLARGFVDMSARGQSDGAGKGRKVGHHKASRGSANAPIAAFSNRTRYRKLAPGSSGNGSGQGNRPEAIAVDISDSSNTETITLETGSLTHVEVTEPGIQSVSYESLRDGGLDLAGVRHGDIAVTWKGQPVARLIDGSGGRFGSGHSIEFIGRPPQGDDALYIDASLYQVSIDRSRARDAGRIGKGRVRNASESYQAVSLVDSPVTYNQQSPTGDPWVEQNVLLTSSKTVTLEVPVTGPVADGPASLVVGLGTITDLPAIEGAGGELPEHNVDIALRRVGDNSVPVPVTSSSTSGQQNWEITADLPAGLIQAGTYELVLRFHTDYQYSLVTIDRYGIVYSAPYQGPRLDFATDREAEGYRVEGFDSDSIVAYAEGVDGSLLRVDPRIDRTNGGYTAELRQVDAARIWVDEAPHTPDVFTTQAPGDLVDMPAGLVVIADSSFIGATALEDYVQSKGEFNPVVVDVEDIYNSVGHGMALPGAVNDYLKAREALHPFTHVQLVGTDCYDRLNYISSCISFIPLPNARVGVNIYSPSQNRLVDLDGDAVGDKPIAQFSVRDTSELETIVAKAASWRANVAGNQSALLVADNSDGTNDFLGQIKRLDGRIGWQDTDVLDMVEHSAVSTARDAFNSSLAAGRALTIFSGHSGPTVWSFRGLLTANTAKTLDNTGKPTMMVPLACETTYDISPNANVLGHQLMYAGDRGALAITGAVSLSSLDDNELMANHIIDGLKSGDTLGEAIQSGRDALGAAFRTLHDNWITQGDVTARLSP